jgi:Transposase DDE domain
VTNQTKRQYRIRNWPDYNKALVSRGSLTLWIDSRSIETWLDQDLPARRGRRRRYADAAILCCLMLREVYHLPLRAPEGLASSRMRLLNVACPVPDYSPLCRRARCLQLALAPHSRQINHLVIDSTGLKLYGEGQWRVRVHNWVKHRTWRKLHLAMDADSREVTAALITNKEVVDPRGLPRLLKQVAVPVKVVYADGAYDARECYKAIHQRGASAVIPPRKGSVVWKDDYLKERNSNLRQVHKLGAKAWKRQAKYHRRSLIECAIFGLKTLLTDRLRSREVERQTTEVLIKCLVLNRMTQLGMPKSYAT